MGDALEDGGVADNMDVMCKGKIVEVVMYHNYMLCMVFQGSKNSREVFFGGVKRGTKRNSNTVLLLFSFGARWVDLCVQQFAARESGLQFTNSGCCMSVGCARRIVSLHVLMYALFVA